MKKLLYIIPALLIVLASCNKKEVTTLNFDAKADKATYKVGDTVKFQLSGNPEQLTFFSGLPGQRYIYKDRKEASIDNVTLEFATNRRNGLDAQQPKSLRLLASQTFAGDYTAAGINETSDWIDITDAFTLSPIVATDNYVSSGVVNLKGIAALGLDAKKPIYFAFKYTGVTGTVQPRWWINKFDIKNTTSDGEVLTVTNFAGATFSQIKVLPTSPISWVFGTDNTAKYAGGIATVASNQVWAITGGIMLTAVTPDKGLALKNMSTRINTYEYVVTQAGTFDMTFLGSNINVYGESSSAKTIKITVTP